MMIIFGFCLLSQCRIKKNIIRYLFVTYGTLSKDLFRATIAMRVIEDTSIVIFTQWQGLKSIVLPKWQ